MHQYHPATKQNSHRGRVFEGPQRDLGMEWVKDKKKKVSRTWRFWDKTGLSRPNTVYKGNEGTTLNRSVMHREDTLKMLNGLRKHMHLKNIETVGWQKAKETAKWDEYFFFHFLINRCRFQPHSWQEKKKKNTPHNKMAHLAILHLMLTFYYNGACG